MPEKPQTASEYKSEQLQLVRSTCLYIATVLGDMMDDIVVVGGLVPSLLIDQTALPAGSAHVGTMDLDVGLHLALFDHARYQKLTGRLRSAGFSQDTNDDGNLTRQRWRITGIGQMTVDFLIPPTKADDQGGRLQNIEADFAAIIAPGLGLAFQDRRKVSIDGKTIRGELARRDVWVCGPGAFVVLKSLAFKLRGARKDAYDLDFVIRNFGDSVEDVAKCLRPLLPAPETQEAIRVLRDNFVEHDGTGPRRVAEFILGRPDDIVQADVVGYVQALLRCLIP